MNAYADSAVMEPEVDPQKRTEKRFQQLKVKIHELLIEQLDLAKIDQADRDWLRKEMEVLAKEACRTHARGLSRQERERLMSDLMDEVFGLGPLEGLLKDPTICDILVNDADTVYIERDGRLEETGIVFADDEHLLRIIKRIVGQVGRRIDESNPMVDARLPDGSRLNAVVPPLALDGPSISIRRFGARPLVAEDLISKGSLPPAMAEFLAAAIEARANILISGGTGAGKTTLLNCLSAWIPPEQRIVTIEDSAELILQHRHCVRMETRTANTDHAGEVTQRDLVRNALRMRPDRILVGEVRGPEVWDMLQAMNTGHEGSLTTVHANSAGDALARLEMMVAMTGFELPPAVVRQYIASAMTLVVHLARLQGGVRRVMQIAEIVGLEDGACQLADIFRFEQHGVSGQGTAEGEFSATGHTPVCLDRLRAAGKAIRPEFFAPRRLNA